MYKLLLIISLFLISCGPSLEEIKAREQYRKDSIAANNASKNELDIPKTGTSKPFYNAAELSLPTGTVIDFAPRDEFILEHSENGVCSEPIYISILHEDGHISINETTYKVWINVYTQSILK